MNMSVKYKQSINGFHRKNRVFFIQPSNIAELQRQKQTTGISKTETGHVMVSLQLKIHISFIITCHLRCNVALHKSEKVFVSLWM